MVSKELLRLMEEVRESEDIVVRNFSRIRRDKETDKKILEDVRKVLVAEGKIVDKKEEIVEGKPGILAIILGDKGGILRSLKNYSKHHMVEDEKEGIVKYDPEDELRKMRIMKVLIDAQRSILDKEIELEERFKTDQERSKYVFDNIDKLGKIEQAKLKKISDQIKSNKEQFIRTKSRLWIKKIELAAKELRSLLADHEKKIKRSDVKLQDAITATKEHMEMLENNLEQQRYLIRLIQANRESIKELTGKERPIVLYQRIERYVERLAALLDAEEKINKSMQKDERLEERYTKKIEDQITKSIHDHFNTHYSEALGKKIGTS